MLRRLASRPDPKSRLPQKILATILMSGYLQQTTHQSWTGHPWCMRPPPPESADRHRIPAGHVFYVLPFSADFTMSTG